jgi:uncharacterized protein (TIGR00369 family)
MEELLQLKDIDRVVHRIFEDKIPFNRLLGLKVMSVEDATTRLRFDMRDNLVGHFVHRFLHGGVTSAALDVSGGMTALVSVLKKLTHLSFEEKVMRFNNLGTIDLRVDYLRPGHGEYFVATGYVLRTGNKVAVTRMELHNDEGTLIAVGTGAYTIS